LGFAERRGNYWRGRYRIASRQHRTVVDERGKAIRFATKGEAQRAASEAENKYRRGDWRDPSLDQETFGEYANRWYAAQDLAASTMQNYRRHIEEHLLPEFEDEALAGILRTDVALWEKKEKAVYAASSVKTWRSTLHLIFEDAIDEGLITANPAARRRGRGKRAGRSRDRSPEKVVTDALGILLTAERAALLSGRDDEFVAVVLKGYTGMRWGEIVGLETEFARPGSIRVEWQLYELDSGELVRCPPKDDSYRTIDAMDWLSALVANHVAHTKPKPCPCHGKTYVFRGQGAARTGGHQGAKLVDVARRADVSTGANRGLVSRREDVAPVRGPTPAGSRSPRALHPMASATPTGP
jgi:integrase